MTTRKLLGAYTFLFIGILYTPIALLCWYSLKTDLYQPATGIFTLYWYHSFFENDALVLSLCNSLLIAAATSVISVCLGVMFAYALRKVGQQISKPLNNLVNMVLIAPDISIAIGLMLVFQAIGFSLGVVAITIAHVTFGIAYATVLINVRLRSLNINLEYAARDLGATGAQTLRLVILPAIKPAVIAALLISFTLSWDDFIFAFYNSSPGQTTLPVEMFALIKRGANPGINAIGTICMLISFTLVFVSLKFQKIVNLL
jgi:spermidine/putrescine transport system permease protein